MNKRPPASVRKPSVPAPNISLELARAARCCRSVTDTFATIGGLPLGDLLDAVCEELSTRTVGTTQERVVAGLVSATWSHVHTTLVEAEHDFARLCSLTTPATTPAQQAKALRRAGVPVEDVTLETLHSHSSAAPARTLLRLRLLQDLNVKVQDGTLAAELQHVYQTTEAPGPLEDLVAHLSGTGMDAERLCWALITFETNQHINLVWHFANKLTRSFPDRVPADLFGWGWQGLRVALRNFDPDRGFAFSTYAGTRIAGSIRDGVRSESPVPKRLTTYLRRVVKAEEDLTQGLGRAPRLEEVAAHLGEDLEQLSIVPRLAPTASIDELTDESRERTTIPRWLVDDADPAGAAIHSSLSEAVERALTQIPEEDRQAVKLLVMEGLDPKEARELTGVDSRKMRRYKERGLAALAQHLSDWESSKI